MEVNQHYPNREKWSRGKNLIGARLNQKGHLRIFGEKSVTTNITTDPDHAIELIGLAFFNPTKAKEPSHADLCRGGVRLGFSRRIQ